MKGSSFSTVNPATGQNIKTYSYHTKAEIDSKLDQAFRSYQNSSQVSISERKQILKSLAGIFREESQSLGKIMSLEMGKALTDGINEAKKCATAFDYYSEYIEQFLAEHDVRSHYQKTKIVKDPIGPVLAIMPWNFPLWQLVRFAAPAVAIGNPIVLKHSEVTAGSAEKIQELFDRVAPGRLFNLLIGHEQAAEIIADPRIRAVTLTGSARAGKEVSATAGKNLKKCVLELGGSDAYIVFKDADVETAAKTCAKARLINNGQSCIAAKRFIVDKSVSEKFISRFKEELRQYVPKDPMAEGTKVGTLAAIKFKDQLLEQCRKLESQSARKIFDLAEEIKFEWSDKNAFFPARVYQVNSKIPMAFEEEFFGPVALVMTFETEDEALQLANRSPYGLGGAVFTSDLDRAEKFAHKMECGMVAVNDFISSAPELPFGGVKDSGFGRELGLYGFLEFCNIKTIGFGEEKNHPMKSIE